MPKQDFKIGADPEFALVTRRDHLKFASQVFKGDVNGQFGLDGSDGVMELRPTPAYDPIDLVKNIRSAMISGVMSNKSVVGYNWKAGSASDHEPTGGHIHFGTKECSPPVSIRSVKPLDVFLTQTILLIEEPSEAIIRRQSSGYGEFGDYRQQSHGIEYRSLGSWLTSPYIAAGVLCLAKAIMYDMVNNELSASSIPASSCMFSRDFLEVNRKVALDKFKINWPLIQKMELYPKYKGYIDFIKLLIDNNKTWYPSCGMKAAWGLTLSKEKPLSNKSIPMVVFNDIWEL